MSKYKLIIEYYQKGNNNSQIATLCSCSRTTVWTILKRIKALEIEVYVLNDMSEEEIACLLFPERAKAGDGYLIPDFKWEEFQMCKHRSSIRLCWRRYCKRAAKQNLMAYSWKCFITLYNAYRKPKIEACDPNDKIRNKLKDFNFLLSCCPRGSINYQVVQRKKEEWLKSLKLEEDKIYGRRGLSLRYDKIYPFRYNARQTLKNNPERVYLYRILTKPKQNPV